jgi:hypothetical protein
MNLADEADTERATLIQNLFEGQYTNPVRIVAFNTAEGWSRDVTEEVAISRCKPKPAPGSIPLFSREYSTFCVDFRTQRASNLHR